MNVIVLTPVRLLGDGLVACLNAQPDIQIRAVLNDLALLRSCLCAEAIQVVLVDVTQGLDLYDLRAIALEWSQVCFVALGLAEQRQAVIQCGRAGFSGYISRDASIDSLCTSLAEIAAGRLACPPEIASSLLRALFRGGARPDPAQPASQALTRRESEVLQLIGDGLSNKEIASELSLSVATVKHHVHHILEKLKLPRRAQAMRRFREAPWLASNSSGDN